MDSPPNKRAKIIGLGSYLPERVMTNFDLEKMVETSDEWIRTRTGIVERRIADERQACSDLACEAARRALADASIGVEDVDLLITATITPDMLFPSTACFVQKKLNMLHTPAFDLSAACTGYVYALSTAAAFIESGRYRTILVIGSEVLSKFVDWDDRSTCVLFGDGAGAAVLRASEDGAGILHSHLSADATHTDLLYLPGGGSAMPPTLERFQAGEQFLKMKGNEVFKIAVNTMVDSAHRILEESGLSPDQIACVIPHQANVRIINAVSKRLGIDEDKVYINVDRFGNTSAATVAIALDEVVKHGLAQAGDYVLLVAFGAGFTSGSVILKL